MGDGSMQVRAWPAVVGWDWAMVMLDKARALTCSVSSEKFLHFGRCLTPRRLRRFDVLA